VALVVVERAVVALVVVALVVVARAVVALLVVALVEVVLRAGVVRSEGMTDSLSGMWVAGCPAANLSSTIILIQWC
jgi:hypothetical protein